MNSMRKIWNVAIYARVSTDKKEQSESIPAQVDSLKKWLLTKIKEDVSAVYNLVEVYEDQGFSGSNFERDSFKRMKEDIEQGKINMVLTRDLSRFSRNYVLAGYYLDDYFKVNNIRFVSVLDNVDSESEFDDIIPFKNILNEMYIKDTSRKIRDALKQRMLRGSSIASKPPYGYKFQEEYLGNVKTISLIPSNDETTEVIKEIFDLYISGWGAGRIATYLNKKSIAPPSAHIKNFGKSKFGKWTNNTILSILRNPKYGGYMVQQRWKKLSYKIKKINRTEKDQWIWVGEFQGIIEKEKFNRVQDLLEKRSNKNRYKNEEIHLFSTVLQCADCSGSMTFRKKYKGYKCTNSQIGGGRCTPHSVKEEFLKDVIVEKLKEMVDKKVNKEKLSTEVMDNIVKDDNYVDELKNINDELFKLDLKFQKLYEDKLNGVISGRNFNNIKEDIEKRQEVILSRKKTCESTARSVEEKENKFKLYRGYIDKILEFEEFDRMSVEFLVDKILVGEDALSREKEVSVLFTFKF